MSESQVRVPVRLQNRFSGKMIYGLLLHEYPELQVLLSVRLQNRFSGKINMYTTCIYLISSTHINAFAQPVFR